MPVVELIAVISSAIFGVLLACRKQMDVVGIFAVAFCVAFGGGTVRDLCLDRHPLFWIAHGHYVIAVFIIALVGSVIPNVIVRLKGVLNIPDAVGLGFFSITGAGYALEAGTPVFVAAILAVVTGTFGGVIADIICNEIPSLFRPAPIYATCAFAGAWVYLLLDRYSTVPHHLVVAAGVGTIVFLRMLALRWNLQLPATHANG